MNYSRGLPTGFTFAGGPVVDLTQQRPAPNRSPLLEEFRSRGTRRRLDLMDIRGHVVEFSSDQYGSRFTQEKLDSASDEERQLVFDEILLSAREVMNDVFGNYVVQKLFEFGTPQQRTLLVDQMHGYVVQLSLCTYGCRVVQRALECVPLSQKLLLSTELEPQVLTCVKDQNANHVVQKLLERLPPEAVDFVPRAFQGNVQALASHCYSCRVLQRVFEHCRADQSRPLLDELMQQPSIAMEDQYGNYVMQWIILHGAEVDRTGIIQVTKGNMLRLSMHKFASNVVEEVVRHAPDIDREELIEETMKPVPARPSAQMLIMMRDQYGNYVVQRLLEHARGTQRERLIAIVRPFLQHMKRFTSGFTKHLNAIERLLDTPGHNTVRVSTGTSTEDLAAKASTALSISDNFNETHLPTLTPAPTNP
ncbi:ARM repeat-containing protein [Acaromyces ingoldii]|uniref:Pumilio homology domain family member 3 n=1 Tax=Acaromyces ingoldii TaxID=215250 RepID=A0A316YX74_9BASI|nr:ARM repeat-containing protein [Acaromyces ingoldii]PWN93791.1 ARM repeat-containing protein [Acaromyces ingoldii]